MGYIKHHTIIVTGWSDDVKNVREKAINVFKRCFKNEPFDYDFNSELISPIIKGTTNNQQSFFIAPDGSKEGWADSDNADTARKDFLDWLRDSDNHCDYVEVQFGGDDDRQEVLRGSKSDL